MSKVLCKSCDLVVELPPYTKGYQCVCPNCGALLRPATIESEFNVAIVAISAFILAIICIFQPYMEISSMGVRSSLSLVSIFTILDYEWSGLLYVFLMVTFISPLVVLMIISFLGIFKDYKPSPFTVKIYSICHYFSMVDVFILGVLVSLIKLSSLAEVKFYSGFYISFLFSILLVWCCIRYRPERLWNRVMAYNIDAAQAGVRGKEQQLKVCRFCGMPFHAESDEDKCPRCGSKVHWRNHQWFQKSLCLLIAALILYLPSNLYPVMYTEFLFSETGANIIQGVIAMWDMQSYFVALVILLASIFIPIFKIIALGLILYTVKNNIKINSKRASKLYRIVLFIGRWSMIDVFVVIIMSSVVRMSGLLTISPGFAIVCFCAVVFITILAADEFDERLIWDNKYARK